MERYEGSADNDDSKDIVETSPSHSSFWVGFLGFIIIAAAAVGFGLYANQEKANVRELARRQTDSNTTIYQLQGQLQEATDKINDMAAQQAAQAAAAKSAQPGARAASAADAARLRRLQTAVDDQQKKLQSTQEDVAKTRSDLEGNIGSTRDELNGVIAKNHDELVLLEKRGERDYVEFDATKAKQFQRTGPVSISVRRTDPKHGNMDLVVLVNDREISKKKINLYEPVWIYESKDAQPVQVVVNQIGKNSVHGYVSAPKYSAADLSASASATPAAEPNPPAATAPQPSEPSESNTPPDENGDH